MSELKVYIAPTADGTGLADYYHNKPDFNYERETPKGEWV